MLFCAERRVVLLHVPRTGGTALAHHLHAHLPGRLQGGSHTFHFTAREAVAWLAERGHDPARCEWHAFVRCPRDRARSAWRLLSRALYPGAPWAASFAAYVRALGAAAREDEEPRALVWARPMADFTEGVPEGARLRVHRFERLREGWEAVCAALGAPPPRAQSPPGGRKDVGAHGGDGDEEADTYEGLSRVYAADIDAFGYGGGTYTIIPQ